MLFFIHLVKYILTVLYLDTALFLQILLCYSYEVTWTILSDSGRLYFWIAQLLGCSFCSIICSHDVLAHLGGIQSGAAQKHHWASAKLCSVTELHWEERLSSQRVAEIHFNAFCKSLHVKLKHASSLFFMWSPSPVCELWAMLIFFSLCSQAGIGVIHSQHWCLSTVAR